MLDYNTTGSCVLVLTLATILVILPMTLRAQRSEKGVGIWFLSGLTGLLLGLGAAVAAIQLMGYDLAPKPLHQSADVETIAEAGAGEEEATDSDAEHAEGDGGSRPRGGMGMGGGRGPSPKRELTMLVRKIDLLTGDIALDLSDEQSSELAQILVRLNSQDAMTDDDATAAQEEILALLDDTQKAKQEAIGLPFRRGGDGRGGRGGPGGAGGGEAAEDANPFSQEENSAAMQSLLQRWGVQADSAAATPTEEAEEPAEEPTEEAAPDAG